MRQLPPYMKGIARPELKTQSTVPWITKNPTVLYGILLEFTRNLFSSEISGDIYPTWDKDTSRTSMWIDTEYEYEAVTPDFRPAVYIWLPQGLKYESVSGYGEHGVYNRDPKGAKYTTAHMVSGTVAWDVVAGTRYEAVDLASHLLYLIVAFSKPLLHEFCIDTFEVTGFNPGGVRKEEREKNVCAITAQFRYSEGATIKLESPKLKKIILNTGQQELDMVD